MRDHSVASMLRFALQAAIRQLETEGIDATSAGADDARGALVRRAIERPDRLYAEFVRVADADPARWETFALWWRVWQANKRDDMRPRPRVTTQYPRGDAYGMEPPEPPQPLPLRFSATTEDFVNYIAAEFGPEPAQLLAEALLQTLRRHDE